MGSTKVWVQSYDKTQKVEQVSMRIQLLFVLYCSCEWLLQVPVLTFPQWKVDLTRNGKPNKVLSLSS